MERDSAPNDQPAQLPADDKKDYHAPVLVDYGELGELTRAGTAPGNTSDDAVEVTGGRVTPP